MKIPKDALIESVCCKANGTRDALSLPFLDTSGKTPMLVATNGHALAAIDVEADKSEHGYVPIAALKHARKLGAKNLPANIGLNSVCSCDDGAQLTASYSTDLEISRAVAANYSHRCAGDPRGAESSIAREAGCRIRISGARRS